MDIFFLKKNLDEAQVKSIIITAGYDTNDYTYDALLDDAGFEVKGTVRMSTTKLRNAARKLNIKRIEISSIDAAGLLAHGTAYQINITLPQDTVNGLDNGKYSLYGFKAVQASEANGVPVVWFKSDVFGKTTTVSWDVYYQGYTSQEAIIPDGTIDASNAYDMTLGQVLDVNGSSGQGVVKGGPSPTAIAINNTQSNEFTCGISQLVGGNSNPMCAFPLYGNQEDVIAPIEKVLLMFATKQINTGTVIEKAYSQGVMIDLTSDNERLLDYDINLGWSWGGFSWANTVAANAKLIPLLIDSSSSKKLGFRRRSLID